MSANAELLGTALGHATRSVPVATPSDEAGAVRASLNGRHFECAEAIAVLEGSSLRGIVPIERLLSAEADQPIASIMDGDPPVVSPGCDQEEVAWRMVRHGESSVAVVDAEGRFEGLIPPHAMLSVLLAEHDEDFARLGGYLAGSQRARTAAEEPVSRRLFHRLPWLIVGLGGAMLSVAIVHGFERQLETQVLLAFFLPAVIYMADAVGTQTEAILIRAMSAGVSVRSVFLRELATGAILGGLVGGTFLPFALLAFGDSEVAVAVAVALFASCSIASVIAMALPWALARAGRDPAFGAGPLATVIQDLLSIVVYFAVATAIAV